MSEISGNGSVEQPNKNETPATPPTDFKIAEIWIRDGMIQVDASDTFWSDKVRAIGVMDLCKDIVKSAQLPQVEKSKIVTNSHGMIDFSKRI